MEKSKKINIIKINNGNREEVIDSVVSEGVLNINVNREFFSALMCTPEETVELAVGYLYSEGVISSMKAIKSIEELEDMSLCIILKSDLTLDTSKKRAKTSGCASGSIDLDYIREHYIANCHENSVGNTSHDHICEHPNASHHRHNTYTISTDYTGEHKNVGCHEHNADTISYEFIGEHPHDSVVEETTISPQEIAFLMKEFNNKSELFRETGGVHSCAICSRDEMIFFSEDIGRHNAIDKVIGKSIMSDRGFKDKILLTTGRISSEIILKTARSGIPIIVSHSAPTEFAVKIARELNITMIGFARGDRMNVYSGEGRVNV